MLQLLTMAYNYLREKPLSTGIIVPFIYSAAPDARKIAIPCKSSPCPHLPLYTIYIICYKYAINF